jgi:hypothetical protein
MALKLGILTDCPQAQLCIVDSDEKPKFKKVMIGK